MNVLFLGFSNKSFGGAVTRLHNILPCISEMCRFSFIELGSDIQSLKDISKYCNQTILIAVKNSGWFIQNVRYVKSKLRDSIRITKPDLVVLGFEMWDLMEIGEEICREENVPFATLMFNLPFLDSPPFPTGDFYKDLSTMLALETSEWKIEYILRKHTEFLKKMKNYKVIVTNETTQFYLHQYIENPSLYTAFPGCATASSEYHFDEAKNFDFVFHARFENGKGIFELPHILQKIKSYKKNFSILMIGKFGSKEDETLFNEKISRLNLNENITFAGWVGNDEKRFELLNSAKVLLYPCLYTDTFPLCVLDSLGLGIPTVVYDMPYAQKMFSTRGVSIVPYKDREKFALESLKICSSYNTSDYEEKTNISRNFIKNYNSWEAVAKAEFNAYCKIVG